MKTKTWKIGEVCQGGIITVEIVGKVISVVGKEWDASQGYNRGSNQSNAKEFKRGSILTTDKDAEWKLRCFIDDLATSYWASTIVDWIKTQVTFTNNDW